MVQSTRYKYSDTSNPKNPDFWNNESQVQQVIKLVREKGQIAFNLKTSVSLNKISPNTHLSDLKIIVPIIIEKLLSAVDSSSTQLEKRNLLDAVVFLHRLIAEKYVFTFASRHVKKDKKEKFLLNAITQYQNALLHITPHHDKQDVDRIAQKLWTVKYEELETYQKLAAHNPVKYNPWFKDEYNKVCDIAKRRNAPIPIPKVCTNYYNQLSTIPAETINNTTTETSDSSSNEEKKRKFFDDDESTSRHPFSKRRTNHSTLFSRNVKEEPFFIKPEKYGELGTLFLENIREKLQNYLATKPKEIELCLGNCLTDLIQHYINFVNTSENQAVKTIIDRNGKNIHRRNIEDVTKMAMHIFNKINKSNPELVIIYKENLNNNNIDHLSALRAPYEPPEPIDQFWYAVKSLTLGCNKMYGENAESHQAIFEQLKKKMEEKITPCVENNISYHN